MHSHPSQHTGWQALSPSDMDLEWNHDDRQLKLIAWNGFAQVSHSFSPPGSPGMPMPCTYVSAAFDPADGEHVSAVVGACCCLLAQTLHGNLTLVFCGRL